MSCAVAIFVKTPGYSPIKTRLAATHGTQFAEDWHRHAAAAVGEVLARCEREAGIRGYWAVAEADATAAPLWSDRPVIAQGDGGLGERMARVHSELVARHGSAILIGADAPQLQAASLQQAAHWLGGDQERIAFGPAHDGGFWLFGSNRAAPESRWTSVTYSRADTGRQFLAAFAAMGEMLQLEALTDLDRAVDLPALRAALAELSAPTTAQRRLCAWLDATASGVAA